MYTNSGVVTSYAALIKGLCIGYRHCRAIPHTRTLKTHGHRDLIRHSLIENPHRGIAVFENGGIFCEPRTRDHGRATDFSERRGT